MTTTHNNGHLNYWWFPMIFGLIFVALGVWILLSPQESMIFLAKIIGVIALVSGTTQMLFTFNNRQGIPGWGFQLTGGIIDLVVGVILIFSPTILLKIITIFVAVWLIVNAITLIMRSSRAKEMGKKYWKWEMGLGIGLILLAILFLWHPIIPGLALAFWSALAFIFLGIFRIVLTFQLRKRRTIVIDAE